MPCGPPSHLFERDNTAFEDAGSQPAPPRVKHRDATAGAKCDREASAVRTVSPTPGTAVTCPSPSAPVI